MRKTCKHCQEPVLDRGLCKIHHKFFIMRKKAKENDKYVPTIKELETIFLEVDWKCKHCKKKMVLTMKESTKMVMTLQHNYDKSLTFLCLSCNTKHSCFDSDKAFYESDPNKKICPLCKDELPLSEYRKCINRPRGIFPYCVDCEKIKNNERNILRKAVVGN